MRKQKRVHPLIKPYKTPRVLLSFLHGEKKKDFQSFLNFFSLFSDESDYIHKRIRI
tara:strand:- start:284 stop:451 length:168 start_codon:yes stop_codon:yes gene_type:complete